MDAQFVEEVPVESLETPKETKNPFFSMIESTLTAYQDSIQTNPLATKAITSCIIALCGELIGSYIKLRKNQQTDTFFGAKQDMKWSELVNFRRLATFGAFGLVVTGPVFHFWYGRLEEITNYCCSPQHPIGSTEPSSSTVSSPLSSTSQFYKRLLFKLFIQQGVFTPPFVLFTLGFIQYFLTLSPTAAITHVRQKLAFALIANMKLWVPCQIVNFAVVPLNYRVLYGNMVALFWNIYLSSLVE